MDMVHVIEDRLNITLTEGKKADKIELSQSKFEGLLRYIHSICELDYVDNNWVKVNGVDIKRCDHLDDDTAILYWSNNSHSDMDIFTI